MEIITIILIIIGTFILFSILIFIGWLIGLYNLLINRTQSIKTQWSNIKTEYQRRADLFYNIVQAVKSHMKFEKNLLTEVVKLRNINFGQSPQEGAKKMEELDSLFSKLMVAVEAYPNIKSGEHMSKFIDEARITEDRVNVARTDYNDVVREFNITVKSFPQSIFARMWNFKEERFYMNEPGTDVSPRVSFD